MAARSLTISSAERTTAIAAGAAVAALLFALPAIPMAASAQGTPMGDPLVHGQSLAEEYCASCHATGRGGDSPNASAPPFRALGDKIELDDFARRLVRGLSSSHPDMPTFKFKPDDARALGAYLLSIQK